MRSRALDAASFVRPAADHPDVCGVVVDIVQGGGSATMIALADGTASMYTSGGGGTIGAGEHATVAQAMRRLLLVAQSVVPALAPGADGSLPELGSVRFHVLTPAGVRAADVPDGVFWGQERHPLVPLVAATQDVISRIREVGDARTSAS
jgi:hypothetical protein